MAELVWKGKHTIINSNQSIELIQKNYGNPALITYHYHPLEIGSETPSDIWHNRLIKGDKASILPALQQEFMNAINLIYIDPPFMTGRTFSNGNQIAYRDTWNNDLDTYLQWLYETLQALYTLLAPDGSLYLHLDWRTIHYAKIILDEIFGSSTSPHGPGFKNEIIWHYQSGGYPHRYYGRKHDTLLLYTKSGDYCFHSERIGQRRGTLKRNHMRKEIGSDGRIAWTIRTSGRVYTYDEDKLMSLPDVWSDISHLHQKHPERTGYATQKPEALLKRIILASSEDDDLVLDCFCGSGVTPAVAEQFGRRWIACDKSEMAITMSCERLLLQQRHHPFVMQEITFQ
jgi:site-specific DNA-methyltransferase (adenine-specific)